MEMDLYSKRLSNVTGDVLVCGIYSDTPLSGLEKRVDNKLDNLVQHLIDSGALSTEYGVLNDPVYTDGALPAEKVLFVGLGEKKEIDRTKVRELSSTIGAYIAEKELEEVCIADFGCSKEFAREMSLGLLLASYVPDEQKTERKKQLSKARILYGSEKGLKGECDHCSACGGCSGSICTEDRKANITKAMERGRIIGEAVNYARMLNNASSNIVTPQRLADEARALEDSGLDVKVNGFYNLRRDRFHALLEVARGSAKQPYVGIMKYHYSNDAPTIALLGKGITFDSGGTSQKPSKGMEGMRMDMSGAGNVIAIMSAITKLKPKVNVIGMFGAVENKDDGNSYNPGDIIQTRAGKTVEVINTDAEGRNILIDLIDKALDYNPDGIIDMATLTGACVAALGSGPKAPAGAFANEHAGELLEKLVAASERSGEWLWNLPVGKYYQKKLKSARADLKHTGDKGGGASAAAQFLFNFSEETPHVHLDIAGTAMGDNATGWGVQLIIDYLMNE